ncbi:MULTISPECIES: S1 family peptidase [Actinoalloteichus]|uniref:Alpha-lytic protease proenzyme n=1 Tax=Actinoalloteichus fjordicus TaxID=1612552 RepID=A0AAC9L783_9PSEU|nr:MULTISPECIES: S1 family peptidase [Actinoalloteichus]APU12478.1 Alpha-lytic protease proenzyme [Actinoalloteichus fjordicus]APU18431.1 Alpha-lytic protease proenzyme [Actinoalloteichus sp. GBA129-24]
MKRITVGRLAAAVIATAGTAVAIVLPGTATATSVDTESRSTATATASPDMLAAMERDLGLTEAEALTRLDQEADASKLAETLKSDLGDVFGGARFDDATGSLVVGVTSAEAAAEVRAEGATAEVVTFSESELNGVTDALNAVEEQPAGVTGFYVDPAENAVVLTTSIGSAAAGEALVAEAGVDKAAVTVVESTEAPEPFFEIWGGDPYYPGSSRCSVGFAVTGGFVTAGHCGGVGVSTTGYNGAAQGTVAGSIFPGRDMGWVRTNASWQSDPYVYQYNGNVVVVSGSTVALPGSSVCRSGSTTGWWCGSIQALNQNVTYPQGTVTGLTRTNVCAQPGDSGGSFITGNQAQGVTSGGSGNCSIGGITYFQPVNPILSQYGLTLTTG